MFKKSTIKMEKGYYCIGYKKKKEKKKQTPTTRT
jgi:hypothetical protein